MQKIFWLITVQNKKIVKIETHRIRDKNIIKIYDNGGGIPKNIIEKIFDPYFTTKHQSQGTGIGLYMSKDIIHSKFNGILEVENLEWNNNNEVFYGACFIIEVQGIKVNTLFIGSVNLKLIPIYL